MNKLSLKLRKTREVALLLMVLLLATHFIYSVHNNEYLGNDTGNPPFHLFQEGNHVIEAVLLEANDKGNSFVSSSVAFPVAFIAHLYLVDLFVSNSYYQRELPDYRKEIKRINPHFFNGSNHKEYTLFI